MLRILGLVLCLAINNIAAAQISNVSSKELEALVNAIRQVETGGEAIPANAVGDGGKAIGPFQIWEAYWKDAVEFDSSIGGMYADCKDEKYARRIVKAYLSRYAPKGATIKDLARIHNGGPKGHLKKATLKYWDKVWKELK